MVMITSFPPPEEGIKHEQHNTRAVMNTSDLGTGTLFIAESRISWIEGATGRGFSLEYPHISLHAVCRDLSSYPEECLYLMLDKYISIDEEPKTNGDAEEEESEEMSELRFVPQDKTCLSSMYQAMSDCQALHPDPNDSLSEDSSHSEGGYESGEEGDEDLNGDKDHHPNGNMEMEVEGQFDDAEP